MLPVVALAGRPNVGKSTLFNRLTRSRDALVAVNPAIILGPLLDVRAAPSTELVLRLLDGSIPRGELERMMDRSYALVVRALRKAAYVLLVLGGRARNQFLANQELFIGTNIRVRFFWNFWFGRLRLPCRELSHQQAVDCIGPQVKEMVIGNADLEILIYEFNDHVRSNVSVGIGRLPTLIGMALQWERIEL